MASWELLTDQGAREIWDDALVSLNDHSPFQTYAWGQYGRGLGWEPCYWAAFNEKRKIVAMILGGLRRYPLGLGLVWSEGAPVGDLSVCDETLQNAMKLTTGLKRLYCRFRCDRERQVMDVLTLSAQGWSRSWSPLTTSYSMSLDLRNSEEELLAGFHSNWRRNLKHSWERNLTVRQWENPTAEEVISIYASMEKLKGLDEQHSREEIELLFKHLKDRMVLYRCDDENGELLSLRGGLVVGDRASGWLAACNERGRELLASYAVLWGIMQHCRKLGVKHFDLAGIDPIRNQGVYRFKKGTGAAPVEYLGEWDWASSPRLQWFGNWAISNRARLQRTQSLVKNSATIPLNAVPVRSQTGDQFGEPTVALR